MPTQVRTGCLKLARKTSATPSYGRTALRPANGEGENPDVPPESFANYIRTFRSSKDEYHPHHELDLCVAVGRLVIATAAPVHQTIEARGLRVIMSMDPLKSVPASVRFAGNPQNEPKTRRSSGTRGSRY